MAAQIYLIFDSSTLIYKNVEVYIWDLYHQNLVIKMNKSLSDI